MNPHFYRITHQLGRLGLALLLFPLLGRAQDETFALIQTKTGVYSNVTVTTKSKDYIVIQHAAGLASLKVSELTLETQEELGYIAAKPKLGASLGSLTVTAKARALVGAIPTAQIESAWNKIAPAQGLPELKLSPTVIGALLGGLLVSYLFFCFCGALICQKAGRPGGILMWLPVLQFIPLLRAAKMSPWWLLGMMVPLLNIWGHILWSFRIAGARGQGFWTALLLVLPTYPLAFIYLAFARNKAATEAVDSEEEKVKADDLVLDAG